MSTQIWSIEGQTLVWNVKEGQTHRDKIEMSGLYCDTIVDYGVQADGTLWLSQMLYFPTLRTVPNNTHATYCFALQDARPALQRNGERIVESPRTFRLDGMLTVICETNAGISLIHRLFPSTDGHFGVERLCIHAREDVTLTLTLPRSSVHSYGRGTKGVYVSEIHHTAPDEIVLRAGERAEFDIFYSSRIANQSFSLPCGKDEEEKRAARVRDLCDSRFF